MKKTLRLFLLAVAGVSCFGAVAEIPAGYYSRLDGKTGAELKTAVHEVINPHTKVSSYSALPQYFQETDRYPDSRQWWDMYSNVARYIPSFSGLNREHAMPKSWWKLNGSVEYTPAYTDLNHLYPSDGPANQAKSNYPLGITGPNPKFDNGVSKIGYPVSGQGGGAQFVYEPADEYKGDFARTYFYMVTCYQNLTWANHWMLQQNDWPTLNDWSLNLLLDWHRRDPVSQKEKDRNEVVYGFQNNRNPFIDYQDLAEYIWGTKVGEPFKPGSSTDPVGDPTLITPTKDMSLDFGQVAVGKSVTSLLYFKGENLTKSLSLSLGGDDRKMFAISDRSIGAQLINSSSGYYLQVTYTPTETGEHNARILIYDGGLPGTGIYVWFRGEAFPTPTLSKLTAYEASDVTSDSYKATWSESPEVVDFYLLTRQRWINGVMTEETIECDENWAVLDQFDASDNESYYVQSSRLGYLSDPSNTIYVGHSGISGVDEDCPLTVESYPGTVRFRCAGVHTGGRVYDTTGRVVKTLPEIEDGMEISLPYGIYMIVTAEHPSPVKIIAR